MDLIQRSQAGDPQAFAALFEQYKNLVFRTALLMLDEKSAAEDILQDVFLQVHHSIYTYRPERGAFTTWLHRITVNACLNLRRKPRFTILPLGLARNHPQQDVYRDEDDALRHALRGLNDKYRLIIILRFYWEYSYAEIAEVLEIPIGTVQSRLHKALKCLRKELTGKLGLGGEEEVLP
jgi:RNA polymerase sigma-70 factor, ECF subfamily